MVRARTNLNRMRFIKVNSRVSFAFLCLKYKYLREIKLLWKHIVTLWRSKWGDGSQKKVLRLTFFTPKDFFFVPFLGLTVNPFGNLHYVRPVFPFNNSKVSVSCRRKRSKKFLSTPAFPWCFYLSTLRQLKAIKRVGPGIENKTNLFMFPNFRPKLAMFNWRHWTKLQISK